jgi:pimeloyl-ACP methyl ester carboxylesterase
MKRRAVLLCAVLCVAAGLARADDVMDLPTRSGVTERVLVLAPSEPFAVVVLLPGGGGSIGLGPNARPERGGNFLVRTRRQFVDRGLAAVVVDVPSDRADLNGSFRESPEHAQDLGAIVRWARGRFGKPVWLVGTSRGTQSAAAAALQLKDAALPDGLVLTSTILSRGGARSPVTALPVTEMALEQLRMPVLVVHHAQDPCGVCEPARLPQLMARLPPGRSELLTFSGGASTGAPCEPFSHHGYNGIEDRVVADIAAWIRARQ